MRRAGEIFLIVKIIQEQWDPPMQTTEPKWPWTMASRTEARMESSFSNDS